MRILLFLPPIACTALIGRERGARRGEGRKTHVLVSDCSTSSGRGTSVGLRRLGLASSIVLQLLTAPTGLSLLLSLLGIGQCSGINRLACRVSVARPERGPGGNDDAIGRRLSWQKVKSETLFASPNSDLSDTLYGNSKAS